MKKIENSELNRLSPVEFKNAEKTPLILVLDNVRSLNNIGSAFRTADAFLLDAIYLCGVCGTPPNKDIHKTALGAEETVTWKYFDNTLSAIEELKKQGVLICSIEQVENSIALNDFKIEKEKKYALIFGNEMHGVEQEVIDQSEVSIEIPQVGMKHSLNISVSIGIVVWDLFKKMKF